ncbi:MAG: MBL fold metallo-hydrolase [Fermentimonas sp.]|jgi:L-ascorbate metabolism protein UlaG (beta-lactamase superfamily)
MRYSLLLISFLFLTFSCKGVRKSNQENISDNTGELIQAKPPATQRFGKEAFEKADNTIIRWLGMSGFLVNSRGTTFMIDPLLEGFDMPILIDFPITVSDVPRLDAILVTHSDNDHFSRPTCSGLKSVTKAFHSTHYVDSLMRNDGYGSFGHDIGGTFNIGNIKVTLTPADHMWQNAYPSEDKRLWRQEDCAGFWIETPDGIIWATGDSQLMPEHLEMPNPDAILFDFSDNEWHFTLEGAVKLANTYPDSYLILHHWGTVDAPDADVFNADPSVLDSLVVNPERIVLLAPGEPYVLRKIRQ